MVYIHDFTYLKFIPLESYYRLAIDNMYSDSDSESENTSDDNPYEDVTLKIFATLSLSSCLLTTSALSSRSSLSSSATYIQ